MCPSKRNSAETCAQPQPSATVSGLREKREQLEVKRQSISDGLQNLSQRDLLQKGQQHGLIAGNQGTQQTEFPQLEKVPNEAQTLSVMEPSEQVDSSLAGLRGRREELEVTCRAFSEGLSALLDGHDEQLAQALKRAALAENESIKYKQQAKEANRKVEHAEKELRKQKNQADDIRKQLHELQKSLEEKKNENVTLQHNLEELSAENAGLKDTLRSMQQDSQAKNEQIETLTGEVNIATEQIAELANHNHELEAEMLETRRIAKSLEQKLVEAEKDNSHSFTTSQSHLVVPAFPVPNNDDLGDEELFFFD
mmetsp:Transcript_683/g.1583  ORF Transcript_683/g.1583 Transcript_683/m.1583 type:complete len:310 (-) Transcript_683:222-1151(-)